MAGAEIRRTLVPLYSIRINGLDLDPVEANFVHQIKITDFLRLPDVCTVKVGYPAITEGSGNPFQKLDDSKFEVGHRGAGGESSAPTEDTHDPRRSSRARSSRSNRTSRPAGRRWWSAPTTRSHRLMRSPQAAHVHQT